MVSSLSHQSTGSLPSHFSDLGSACVPEKSMLSVTGSPNLRPCGPNVTSVTFGSYSLMLTSSGSSTDLGRNRSSYRPPATRVVSRGSTICSITRSQLAIVGPGRGTLTPPSSVEAESRLGGGGAVSGTGSEPGVGPSSGSGPAAGPRPVVACSFTIGAVGRL